MMETFLVLQVLWEFFLVTLFALGLTFVLATIAPFFFTEKQIEDFLNKQ
tara:strand:- start:218 stop:364 length:147 start_codon:yes stop_codon:yes gene_type:complete